MAADDEVGERIALLRELSVEFAGLREADERLDKRLEGVEARVTQSEQSVRGVLMSLSEQQNAAALVQSFAKTLQQLDFEVRTLVAFAGKNVKELEERFDEYREEQRRKEEEAARARDSAKGDAVQVALAKIDYRKAIVLGVLGLMGTILGGAVGATIVTRLMTP